MKPINKCGIKVHINKKHFDKQNLIWQFIVKNGELANEVFDNKFNNFVLKNMEVVK